MTKSIVGGMCLVRAGLRFLRKHCCEMTGGLQIVLLGTLRVLRSPRGKDERNLPA